MTYRQRKMPRNREKCLEKGKWYYEENKDRLKKWLVIDTRHSLKKKKNNKRSVW